MVSRLDPSAKIFRNVQGLRAIAALLVFAVHLNGSELRFNQIGALNLFSVVGEWGVDLFFVISGFVMITSTWDEFQTPGISWRFFLRRATRIYPAYWVVLLPILALFLVAPSMVNGSQEVKPNVLASFLLLPQLGKPLLTVSWTLVYEMFFYVVFALVLSVRRSWCVPLMLLWGAVTLLIQPLVSGAHNPYVGMYTGTLLLEFIFGVMLGYAIKVRGAILPVPSLIAGLIAIGLAVAYYPPWDAAVGHSMWRFLLVGGPMTLIFNGILGLEMHYKIIAPRPLQAIGDASYSLYLWHVPLTILLGRISMHLALRNPIAQTAWLAVVVVFVVGASLVLYRVVEQPLLRFSRPFLKRFDLHFGPVHLPISAIAPVVHER